MKMKPMKKRFLLLLMPIALLMSCTPQGGPPDASVTDAVTSGQVTPPDGKSALTIVADGKSDFAILADLTDPLAKSFALTVQNAIRNTTGVMLPLRGADELDRYEHKILIGDTGSPISEELKAQTPENAYAVRTDAETLALYASGTQGYLLLDRYFTDTLFASAAQEGWELNADLSYSYDPVASASHMTLSGDAEYKLIYSATDPEQWLIATRLASYIRENSGLNVTAAADSQSFENEILLGSVERDAAALAEKYITEEGAYLYGVLDDSYVIYSTEPFGIALGAQQLVEAFNSSTGTLELSSADNAVGGLADCPKDALYANAVQLSKSLYGTYSSWVEKQLSQMSQADQDDQALVEALISRMGDSLAVMVGSSSALHQGFVVKLDTVDYGKVTKRSPDGHILVAVDFASQYFGDTLTADADGYVDLTAYCAQSGGKYTLYDADGDGVAVVTPAGVAPFDDPVAEVNGYTNRQYLARMLEFFRNPVLPEPTVNVEQTRVEIVANEPDPTYVYDYTREIYICYGSPAILSVGDTLYAAYDETEMSMASGNSTLSSITRFLKSIDGGKTWTELATVKDMTYGGLCELDGKILLLGVRFSNSYVVVCIYDPVSGSFESGDLGFSVMGTAPTAIAVANGRIWRAHNNAVISAPVTSDLLKAESWTKSVSPNEVLTQADYEAATGQKVTGRFWLEEGNIVLGRDGELYAIYRIDASPTWGYAAIFRISEDGRTLTPVQSEHCVADGFIAFPSGQSKFMIKYDEATGRYLTFVSLVTNESPHQRNVMALLASEDLLRWEIVDVLLVEREMMNNTLSMYAHAFQYIDFDFVGDDIVMIVREAFGNACNYHNSNAITLYTLSDYAAFIRERLPQA